MCVFMCSWMNLNYVNGRKKNLKRQTIKYGQMMRKINWYVENKYNKWNQSHKLCIIHMYTYMHSYIHAYIYKYIYTYI